MVTARDFIAYVYVPLREAWGYIYGTWGRKWTESLQKAWSQPPHKNYEQTRQYGAQWIGRMVTDCSGLLRWALAQLGAEIIHQARYQYTDASRKKGRLVNGKREDGQPILPGTAVFLQGGQDHIHHVGVYVGHGICIEAKGTRWGVVTSEQSHWDHWGELKVVDYTDAERLEDEPVPDIPERKEEAVKKATVNNPQKLLNVRARPDEKSTLLFRVEKGETVDVLNDEEAEWWQIRYGGRIGWAFAAYLKPLEDHPASDSAEEEPEVPEEEKKIQEELGAILFTLQNLTARVENILGRIS